MNKLQQKMTSIKSAILILLLFFCFGTKAQNNIKEYTFKSTVKEDTIKSKKFIKELAKTGREQGALSIKNNKLFREQSRIFNEVSTEIQNADVILKKGIDYKNFSNEFKIILDWKERTTKGITINQNKVQTVRDLTTTSILLEELLNRTNFWLEKIKKNNVLLGESQNKLDSLSSNESLYIVPIDSVSKEIYYQRYIMLSKDLDPLNTKLNNVLDSIQTLQIQGNILKYSLETDIIRTNLLRKSAFENLSIKSIKVFIANSEAEKSFVGSIVYSMQKGIMVFTFYIINDIAKFIFMLLFFIGLVSYLKLLKYKYIKAGIFQKLKNTVIIFQYPIATAIIVTTTIFQFIFPSAPFIIISFLWLTALFAISLILYKSQKNKTLLTLWTLLIPIFFIAIGDNLILLHTVSETWIIIFTAIFCSIIGIYGIYNRKKINNKFYFYVICMSVFLNCFAIYCMIVGLYDLGKMSMTNGVYTLLILSSFLYTYHLFNAILKFSNYLKVTDEEKKFDSLTENTPNNIPKGIYFLFFIGWFMLSKRNNYSYQSFLEPIITAFSENRQIGDFTFSYYSIFLFIFIIFLSGIISKIVSFLASETKSTETNSKSSGLGSWLLLIRIGIICSGVLIAFASAGIPIDRITMIISALGVGIGFGLQNLVNNLVSGLIIAFEKPVNLDDIIEINGQIGIMKSIGIRSSVISTWDGADVIIPNGDLLSQHLTNWTIGSQKRRYEIQVGVAYGSDLTIVKNILNDILLNHQLVLKNPMPMIWVTKFGDSSIDYVIKYWVPHFNYGNDVKSELLISIDEAFKDHGIVIPFPQQDIHIISNVSENNEDNLAKK